MKEKYNLIEQYDNMVRKNTPNLLLTEELSISKLGSDTTKNYIGITIPAINYEIHDNLL